MIGKVSVDIAHLAKYPNVVFLGRKAYEELPGYCKAFSVGLIPFAINELTLNVNPIKLREYLRRRPCRRLDGAPRSEGVPRRLLRGRGLRAVRPRR